MRTESMTLLIKFWTKHTNTLNGKFTDFDNSLKILLDTTVGENLKSIPCGKKENVDFVIDYDMTSKNRTFVDDCGAWNKPSFKNHHYLATNTGKFAYIHKKQNQFFKKEKGNLVLLDPQPDVNSVVILSRYHSKHRKDKKFQKRVSCFQNVPKRNDLHMMCLFKYIGNYPGEQIHGNSKRTNQPYIRTTLAQKSAILEGIKHGKKPSAIPKDLEKIDTENLLDLKSFKIQSITKKKPETTKFKFK